MLLRNFLLALAVPHLVCADIDAFRSDRVKSSLDMSKADGLWYEIGFHDIAQIGASCQKIQSSLNASTGKVTQHFDTRYGPIPFAQTYTYEPAKSGEKGVFVKYLNGAKALLTLPTVIVDVVDGEDGKYELLTEFTLKTVIKNVTELRLSARTPSVDAATLQKMKAVAASVGIPQYIIDSVKVVDHSRCSNDSSIAKDNLVVAGSDVHPERAAQIAELKAMLGMTWTPVAHPRFANQKPGASKDLCGVKGDQQKIIKEAIARGEISEYHADANAAVPDSFDSAANWPQCAKVILDIRDQSNCGCCWAFGGTSAATDRMCIATNATLLLPLSAQDVCFNSNFDGCDGGQITTPWSYIKSTGAVTGSQQQPDDGKTDPFKGMGFCSSFSLPHCHHHGPTHGDPYPAEGAQGCAKQSSPQGPTSCDSGAKAPHNEFNSDKYTFSGQTISPNGESSIQQAIMEGGPVEVAFTVYSDFENYGGGIYQHKSGGQVGGHAVKMVGWGVDNGVKYWKIANSWNPYWGEKGYFRIIRGQNEGGIESQVAASAANAKWSKRAPGPAPGPSPPGPSPPSPPMPANCGAHFKQADCEAAATEGCHWCPKFGMGMCFNKEVQCPGNVVV